ncbi:MAG: HD-GYP domain-containing protein [Dehalococcoidia bacterium]
MRRALPELLPWTLAILASSAALVVLRARPALDAALQWRSPAGHVEIVTAVSALCAVLAAVVCVVVRRSANPRLLWLAMAFLMMSGLYAVHGLTTPGILIEREYSAVIGFSGRIAFLTCAGMLAASAVDWRGPTAEAVGRARGAVIAVTVVALAAYAGGALRWPEIIPVWFAASRGLALGTTLAVLALGAFAAYRYFVGYRRSGLTLYGAVTVATLLVMEAQVSMHLGSTWRGTFWLYHVQLLAGCLTVLWAILAEYGRGRALHSIQQLTASDVIGQLRAGHNESIVSLAAALEGRDGYTLGHGERVAALAILVGQHMRVPAPRLRAIAAGALLHDVGKIGIPDAVLHKRGPLTEAEHDVIKEHTVRGDTMISAALGGTIERAVVRHHHERWDGRGYPDRLAGEAIPLEARIVAVADVYDALRSNRAYRPAHTRAEAIAMVAEGAGTQFDPRCAGALLAVAEEWERQYAADHLAYDERRSA